MANIVLLYDVKQQIKTASYQLQYYHTVCINFSCFVDKSTEKKFRGQIVDKQAFSIKKRKKSLPDRNRGEIRYSL